MTRRIRPDVAEDVVGDSAQRRTHELETLRRLGSQLTHTLDVGETLERALSALTGMGWFVCGEAYDVAHGRREPIVVGSCPYAELGSCPLRESVLDAVADLEPDDGPRLTDGWWLLPVEKRAVLALKAREDVQDVSDEFLGSAIAIVASALRRAALHERLAEKERQRARLLGALLTAQEEERGRISRDLHDQIGQALTGLLLGLDAALDDPDRKAIERLKELTSATLADVRRIALDLRPSVLDELGLEPAVRRFARDVHERYGLAVHVAVHLPRLSSQVETVLYRVTQEALTNVVRHAAARTASVVATAGERQIQLVVEDDGQGFDRSALAPSDEIGLAGMQERLELLGGILDIESTPGKGTTVYARVPRRSG